VKEAIDSNMSQFVQFVVTKINFEVNMSYLDLQLIILYLFEPLM